jgi:hypothetical protein
MDQAAVLTHELKQIDSVSIVAQAYCQFRSLVIENPPEAGCLPKRWAALEDAQKGPDSFTAASLPNSILGKECVLSDLQRYRSPKQDETPGLRHMRELRPLASEGVLVMFES